MKTSLMTALLCLLPLMTGALAQTPAPSLRSQGDAVQFMVDGEPYLMLGGELGNSSASDLSYLEPHWETFDALHINTILAPVYWELIEPEEGVYDFTVLDQLITRARREDIRLVLLWFGTWKNSMSTYVPEWGKQDDGRFFRVRTKDGTPQDIFSPHDEAIRDADAHAFRALMAHLAETDRRQRTVIMVQVENEVGMIPEARDHSAPAEEDWQADVPAELMARLEAGDAGEHLMSLWQATGSAESGSWQEVFGNSPEAEEIFTAWHLGRFVEHVTAAGLDAYDLPVYVNAALARPDTSPGGYPSGGPLPHLFAVWQAAAPSLDFLAPDIYFNDFVTRIAEYDVDGNAVFIPEANRTGRSEVGADAFWSFGELDSIGYSPFSIEDIEDGESHPLGNAYDILDNISHLITANQGNGTMRGLRAPIDYDGEIDLAPQTFTLENYQFTATMIDPWTPRDAQDMAGHGALIIALSDDEFLVAGKGVTFTFDAEGPARAGIAMAEEGRFGRRGEWEAGRTLNGDQTHQGRHIRLTPDAFAIQKFRLYTYK
ncbi:GH35 family beta-galactosidase [Parvularcula marina]|uniref:Beta-galactosidase n=1 Tax=Parvularcula marina TaxID=2292771 RepID=A0A371RL27_9PROT|nr:DUF5597 domain-containing protein [Parvularcula marina]RFB06160.1 hypothetical protein DX908_13315 [Parvularcula marina]